MDPSVPQSTPSGNAPYWLRIRDVEGSYSIPFIHSGRRLRIRVDFGALPAEARRAMVTLRKRGEQNGAQHPVRRGNESTEFAGLCPGEYVLSVSVEDSAGNELCRTTHDRFGIGSVIAALGDSLTEGYHGHGFKRFILDLESGDFPKEAVSADGRNFPQFAPTTKRHKPEYNCLESWMTRLNNGLTDAWKQPVFIANEGWGGTTSKRYLDMIRENHGGWADRMRLLAPTVWLVHLGVNDERHGVPPQAIAANMRGIVEALCSDYAATADRIYIARPSYDYAPGAAAMLEQYITQLDLLIAELGLRQGPDFYAAFASDRERWYGADPVHPASEGIALMADLWLKTLAPHPPTEVRPALSHVLTVPTPLPCRFLQALCRGEPQTIVTYGTSLTDGAAWVDILRSKLEHRFPGLPQVVNAGKGAMDSTWGLANIANRVLCMAPDAVFIEFSVNDAYLPYHPDLSRCEANLQGMVQRILHHRPACEIVLMVMNPMVDSHAAKRPQLERFNDVYRRVAREQDLLLIDHYPAWQRVLEEGRAEFDRLVPDGAHPNQLGCTRIIATGIMRAIGLHDETTSARRN